MTFGFRRAITAGAMLGALSVTKAQADMRGWTLCTAGTFHSCHSVSLATAPIISGSVRTGTVFTIRVTNLQGSHASDNTLSSALEGVAFWRTTPVSTYFSPSGTTGTAGGGATGTAFGGMYVNDYPWTNGNRVAWSASANIGVWNGVAGCADPGMAEATAMTCGPSQWFSFSFQANGFIADAGDYSTVYIYARGIVGSPPVQQQECFSDPSKYPFTGVDFPACDVLEEFGDATAAPEPVSIALLGTGLLGVGGVRWRRRKRTL